MINNALLVCQLGLADRDAYFQLRLRGLKAHPESFGQSYEDAVAKGAARHDAMLEGTRAAEGDFLLGAYESANTPLIGVVGLLRNQSDKERHKASVVVYGPGFQLCRCALPMGIHPCDHFLRRHGWV